VKKLKKKEKKEIDLPTLPSGKTVTRNTILFFWPYYN